MAEYTPFASLLLAETLAEDPFGTVHRGLERDGSPSGRSVLVRRYHTAWLEAGLHDRQGEIRRNLIQLGQLKVFAGCHLSVDGAPHLVWPFSPGRSLAQVLATAEAKRMPFGADQALFLIWGLAHHIRHLHGAGLPLGFLTPHRVWMGYDGYIQLLDAPVITLLQSLAPRVPGTEAQLASYLKGPREEGLAHDTWQLGVLLFEMLTHHPLPAEGNLAEALEQATLLDEDGTERPLPRVLIQLLNRLLGWVDPYPSLKALELDLEQSMFGGEFDPTSFGMAFLMHSLFREEIEQERRHLIQERDNSGVFRALEAAKQGAPPLASNKGRGTKLLPWVASLVACVSLFGLWALVRPATGQSQGQALASAAHPPVQRHASESPEAVHDAKPEAPTPESRPPVEKDPSSRATQEPKVPQAPPIPSAPPRATVPNLPQVMPPASQVSSQPAQVFPQPAQAAPRPAVIPASTQVPAPVREPARLLSSAGAPGGVPVRLRICVDERGRAIQAHVVQGAAPGSSLERMALMAALQSRFEAAREGGRPCRDWLELTLTLKP